MINSRLLTGKLAEKIAGEAVKSHVTGEAAKILRTMIFNRVKESAKEDEKKLAHDALFNALFKSLAPFEKKFEAMLKRIWAEEEKILISNIKKMKKAWLHKDKIDDIMYPQKPFEKILADGSRAIFVEVMSVEGPRVVKLYDFDMVFDVNNPEVKKWLKSYTPMFSKRLEEVSVEKLKRTLIEGIDAGEGVPELTRRVYETYNDWGFKRAEAIAQNQVIRASNKAALNVYRQSGVVEKKIWISYLDERVCPHCEALDGKVIGIESNYFDLGGESVVKVDDKEQKLKMDYEPIDAPPLHNRCRCSVGAIVD